MKIGLQAWGSEGDIHPFIALAAGLVEAKHEVTLVVSDNAGRDYSALAKRFGFQIVPIANPLTPTEVEIHRVWLQIIEAGNPLRQAEIVMKYGFDPLIEEMYSHAKRLCSDNDLVIGHFFVYPLQVAAELANKPWATVNIVHNCIPSREIRPPGMPNLGKWARLPEWKLVQKIVNGIFLSRANALRQREGLLAKRDMMDEVWASDRLNLIAVSPQICERPRDWAPKHKISGFLNPPAALGSDDVSSELLSFLDAGEPPVYFTFGSMMVPSPDYIRDTLAIWIRTVERAGCRAIVQIPSTDLKGFLVPDRVFKVNRAPYKKVFPRCALVVHHGGAGTTQSALLAGIPTIIVAHVADQFFWGSELERLKVAGRTLHRKNLSYKRLANEVRNVMNQTELGANSKRLGEKMASEDGVRSAVKMIREEFGC